MGNLVLWGHHLDEYQEMFDLQDNQLSGSLLEFGCGPSAVNCELKEIAQQRVSCDPLFSLDLATLKSKAALIFAEMLEEIKINQHQFDFSRDDNLNELVTKRQQGMARFFADYEQGLAERRYQPVQDINLAFADFSFDLALSSHYFFAQLDKQDQDFHLQAIKELARVAHEVRIFPLLDREGQLSPLLGPVLLGLQQANFGVEVRSIKYHLQPQGNAMLRVWAQECVVK